VTERSREPEILDAGGAAPADVARSLDDMSRINRRLGGWSALRRHLLPRLEPADSLLDAGCGGCGMARRLERAHLVGLDREPAHLAVARERSRHPPLVAGDLLTPPFAAKKFDYAYSMLTLHHLGPEELVRAVRELARVTSKALILHDLIRVRRALWLFRLLGPLLRLHPITRHDGLVSIRRAYTPEELRAILAEAGFSQACVYVDRLFCRMTAVVEL